MQPPLKARTLLKHLLLLSIVYPLVCALLSAATSATAGPAVLGDQALPFLFLEQSGQTNPKGPVTVTATWDWIQEETDLERICLVGLARSKDSEQPELALSWGQEDAGWFTIWRLQLHTSLQTSRGTGVISLMATNPQAGSTYKAVLSYDPAGGVASVALYDLSSERTVYQGSMAIVDDAELPVVAASGGEFPGVRLLALRAQAGYQPVGDRLRIGDLLEDGTFIPRTGFAGDGVGVVVISSEAPGSGEYRVRMSRPAKDSGAGTDDSFYLELGTISPIMDENRLVLPLEQLPPGPLAVHAEYVDDGQTQLIHSESFTVGRADCLLQVTSIERERGLVRGEASIDSPRALPGVVAEVEAQYFSLTWDETSNAYKEELWGDSLVVLAEPVETIREAGQHPFSLPLPEPPGAWRLDLTLRTTPAVAGSVSGGKEYFFNHKAAADYWVATTDQGSQRILVFDPNEADWDSPKAVKWSWSPNESNGFFRYMTAWGKPSDVKLRRSDVFGGEVMLVVDSQGFAAIVPYPAGDSFKWFQIIGGNLHAAELLPDGNMAIAASTGGWIRIYTSSQGRGSAEYAQFDLPGAHGVLWDPQLEVLWALGDYHLIALRITGPASRPVMEKVRESKLPSLGGHDLSPVYGDTDRLWVTTNSRAYQYIKSTDSWVERFVGGDLANRPAVKGIGNQPSGQVVWTQQKEGSLYTWSTDTVTFVVPGDSRKRTGAAFYKARIWSPEYQ